MRSNTYRRLVGILLLIAIIVVAIAYKMYKGAETQLNLTKPKAKQISLLYAKPTKFL